MRYIMIGKLFMQPVIYVEEKIVRSTVNKQLEVSGLYQMDQPHHRMFIPGVGMVMITSDALLYVPVIRKRTDIHTSGGTPGEGKKILMAKSQIQRPMPAHTESCNSTVKPVAAYAVTPFNIGQKLPCDKSLVLIVCLFGIPIPAIITTIRTDNHKTVGIDKFGEPGRASYPVAVFARIAMQ